jgi:hypothetical protein
MLKKQGWISVVLIFITWQMMDFLIHGKLLMNEYENTLSLWRPKEEMMMPLMWVVSLISAWVFTWMYEHGFQGKGKKTTLVFALMFGIIAGSNMGFGTYSFQPITMMIAKGWFFGAVTEFLAAGLILMLIHREA